MAGCGPTEQREAGHMLLEFAALSAWPDGDAYSGNLAAGAVAGQFWEEPAAYSVKAPFSTGVVLRIARGVLAAA